MDIFRSKSPKHRPFFATPLFGLGYLFSLFILLFFSLHSSARDHTPNEMNGVYRLPAYVKDVRLMGSWAYRGKGNGMVRMSITEFAGTNKVFIQWLSRAIPSKPSKVHSTVSIKEINESGKFEITHAENKLENGVRVISMKLLDKHNRKRQIAKITLHHLGKYKFEIRKDDNPISSGPL